MNAEERADYMVSRAVKALVSAWENYQNNGGQKRQLRKVRKRELRYRNMNAKLAAIRTGA